jgi:hypothetical protein
MMHDPVTVCDDLITVYIFFLWKMNKSCCVGFESKVFLIETRKNCFRYENSSFNHEKLRQLQKKFETGKDRIEKDSPISLELILIVKAHI